MYAEEFKTYFTVYVSKYDTAKLNSRGGGVYYPYST